MSMNKLKKICFKKWRKSTFFSKDLAEKCYRELAEINTEWLTQKLRSDDNEVGTGMWNAVIKKLLEELK